MTPSSVRTVAVLNERSREIFRRIVESYVETGEPVGSRTLSRSLRLALSPATIRNVMADLQEAGLLYAPHTSAGRLPTEAGLRLFVDGLLEIGGLTEEERTDIDVKCSATGRSVEEALAEATSMLSGLADCAGLVFAPKSETPLKHIEFVGLTDGRALVVMVGENGVVENRLIAVPVGIPPSALVEARNFLSARLVGRTLTEARAEIAAELKEHRVQLDQLTTEVVETGLATWAGESQSGYLIVKGQAKLLENITAIEDLEQIRTLFQALETKETMARLLELAHDAEGVQIFIGADNALFALAGCSMVVAPFANSSEKIVGAIGVIGPTRINYARIIPMVDYTAKVISRVIG
ncbi:MAG: heat-inducible transcriptional repressor HrcA [Alphaproteobacteria bacterium]|nr:heat-inducible transcriptional repressor HrcA [Alphaproteobacteria bacterium]